MRVLGMGVRCVVVMVMIVVVMMVMIVTVVMVMVMVICGLEPAQPCAEGVAQGAIRHVRARRVGALPFHVMVVAFLYGAYFCLESEDLRAVFAQNAGRRWHVAKGGVLAVFGADVAMLSVFEGKDLFSVGADAAVWRRVCGGLFDDAFGKGFKHLGVVPQIACLDEGDLGMFRRDLIGETVDAVDQDARE